jgi:N-acetylglucosaminyldiphosphoundecaprenol N-acetyl-beta-D-mannosaminyltransferase
MRKSLIDKLDLDRFIETFKSFYARDKDIEIMGDINQHYRYISALSNIEFPNIKAGFYSPPYRENFLGVENEEILKHIKEFNPDVLFVGLTAPNQEKWLYRNKDELDFKIACCIGAVFDFYAGTIQRSSPFWVNNHMEWLTRLVKEPKRMWRRNFVSTPIFLKDIMLYKTGLKK